LGFYFWGFVLKKILKERAEVLQDEVASILNQLNSSLSLEEELLQE
jgi:hypothetical protein